MFETLMNTNRTRVLFGSVRCGAELEQTEHDFENVLFCLFVWLAISGLGLIYVIFYAEFNEIIAIFMILLVHE